VREIKHNLLLTVERRWRGGCDDPLPGLPLQVGDREVGARDEIADVHDAVPSLE
jgi:hypothetical protein